MIPDFDPKLHDWVMRQQGFIPSSADGQTHFLVIAKYASSTVTQARCNVANARVSQNWSLVNCENCRRLAEE